MNKIQTILISQKEYLNSIYSENTFFNKKDLDLNFGDYLLVQQHNSMMHDPVGQELICKYSCDYEIQNINYILPPQLCIFGGYTPCDQTVGIILFPYIGQDKMFIKNIEPQSFEHIQWVDELSILNVWKYKPSFKEIFQVYRKRIKECYLITYKEKNEEVN